ncbi:DUF481 domain-containing protein [Parvularcula sp. ZS-1/3]|uniref:DUF481 domain-containing protein n=1 Tax=Parvularcula mediterranea TaxID=2732508 RepID=A0A7Y3RMC5_9PROT|nr:DUF481 domain-containing protein [Parvularcula mediterranea]NNU16654.1 DUF481 domain-containing protein [Parvularcula mediterranea]
MRNALIGSAAALTFFAGGAAFADEAYLAKARATLEAAAETGDAYVVQSVLDAFVTARPDLTDELTAIAQGTPARPEKAAPEAAPAPAPAPAEPLPAAAQEVPAPAREGFWQGWSGSATSGFEVDTGNTEEVELDLSLDLTRGFGKWEVDTLAQANFGDVSDVRVEEQYRGRIDLRREFTPKWSLANFAEIERDLFSGFDYRATIGFGPSYKIFNRDTLKWRVSAGPGVRFDKPAPTDADVETNGIMALESRYRQSFVSNKFRIGNDLTGSFGEAQVYTILSFGEVDLNSRLSARASYQIEIESDAPPTASASDTTTLLSLVYKIGSLDE